MWTHGPPWLTNHDHWPEWKPNNVLLQSSFDKDQETSEVTAEVTDTSTNASITQIIAPTKFSEFQRLLRTTAWVLHFVNSLKKGNVCKGKPLKVHEVENARNVWTREIQNDAYGNELANIQKPKTSRLPLVRQLRLFTLEESIIRCGGRIHNAPTEHSAKFPILLPPNHHFTLLVVNDAHGKLQHARLNQPLTQIRQKYWIPKARQYIKKILPKCVTCRKVFGTCHFRRAPNNFLRNGSNP